ncbi:MAG: 2-hydroxychromene-2-carboxylate isomerase [Kiloniellales bacterium]
MAKEMEFWFEFASTYSYLSIMRVDGLARDRGVAVTWRPFLLGPIFAEQGWTTSPFNLYPAKGDYMWRDLERRAASFGIPFRRWAPSDDVPFPQNSLKAARLALIGLDADWGRAFCQSVFHAEFSEGADITDASLLSRLADQAGAPADVLSAANDETNKLRLRATVEEAKEKGLFGAPSFVVGGELFWGDDRLEDALDWASSH